MERLVPPVRRHLAATRVRVVSRCDGRQEHLRRRHAEREAQGAVAVIGIEPVVRGTQHPAGGDEHRLVPGARYLEEDLVLALELDLPVVETAGEVHDAEHVEQVRLRERLGGLRLRLGTRRHGTKIAGFWGRWPPRGGRAIFHRPTEPTTTPRRAWMRPRRRRCCAAFPTASTPSPSPTAASSTA